MTPSLRNFWKIIRTSSSFIGEIFMIDLTSHWPLMRERTKPSWGEKERFVSAWSGDRRAPEPSRR